MNLPEGFRFHEGFDGLLLGTAIVFVVKVQRTVRMWLDWRLVPAWAYEPFVQFFDDLVTGLANTGGSLSGPSFLPSSGGGGSSGTDPGTGAGLADLLADPLFGPVLKTTGIPIALFDAFSASVVEQLLLIVGFWIAVLVPLRWWVVRPLLFWWRNERSSI